MIRVSMACFSLVLLAATVASGDEWRMHGITGFQWKTNGDGEAVLELTTYTTSDDDHVRVRVLERMGGIATRYIIEHTGPDESPKASPRKIVLPPEESSIIWLHANGIAGDGVYSLLKPGSRFPAPPIESLRALKAVQP